MTALEIAKRLRYCVPEKADPLIDEANQIAAMIVGLAKSLQTIPIRGAGREDEGVYFADY